MRCVPEFRSTFSKAMVVMAIVGVLALVGIYFSQKTINEAHANNIIDNVWVRAKMEKARVDSKDSSTDDEDVVNVQSDRANKVYSFSIIKESTPTLIKVETGKTAITSGVCKALKNRFTEGQWQNVFEKVLVIDRMGNERTNVFVYDCPSEKIYALRFYVKFAEEKEDTDMEEVSEESEPEQTLPTPPAPVPNSEPVSTYTPVSSTSSRVSSPVYSKPTCPSGTSVGGSGGFAVSGCRCNRSDEVWNGRNCEIKSCPFGSSKRTSGMGDMTNVSGCRCNDETPVWAHGRCVVKCSGSKVWVSEYEKCVCPAGMIARKGDADSCVECNDTSDCFVGDKCVNNKCVANEEEYDDCRWGICQTCDDDGVRENIPDRQECEVGGLLGECNENGTCYPIQGQPCSSVNGCGPGQFCNYGGTFDSSNKQRGKFGKTADVCQNVEPLEFTYQKTTYYYNSAKDLKSWCRAANNKPNCLWGYLAKSGAESWCASLGKRLLTRAEMAKVWDVLKKELPQTYTGYTYWVQEGAWIEDVKGKLSFGTGRPDGYGGKGGVVCK